jgi:hypothetical protein
VLGSNLGWTPAIPTEVFCGFPYTLQANARIVLQLSHVCILPNPFPFIMRVIRKVTFSELLKKQAMRKKSIIYKK